MFLYNMFLTVKPPKAIQSIAMAGTVHAQIRPRVTAISSAFFMSIYLLSFFVSLFPLCRSAIPYHLDISMDGMSRCDTSPHFITEGDFLNLNLVLLPSYF